jgi:hypothetical protein
MQAYRERQRDGGCRRPPAPPTVIASGARHARALPRRAPSVVCLDNMEKPHAVPSHHQSRRLFRAD